MAVDNFLIYNKVKKNKHLRVLLMKITKMVEGFNLDLDIESSFDEVLVTGRIKPFLFRDEEIVFYVRSDLSGNKTKSVNSFDMQTSNRLFDRYLKAINIVDSEMKLIMGDIEDLSGVSNSANMILEEMSYKDMMFSVNEMIDIDDASDIMSGDLAYMYLKFANKALYNILLTPNINQPINHSAIHFPEVHSKNPEIESIYLGDYLIRSESFDWVLNSLRKMHEAKKSFGSERGRKLQELAFSITSAIFKKSAAQMAYSDEEKSAEDILRLIKIIKVVRDGASLKIEKAE